MKTVKIILASAIAIFLAPSIMAAPDIKTKIEVKSSFAAGETMCFDYTFQADSDTTVFYTPYIFCPNMVAPFIDDRVADLKKDTAFKSSYCGVKIDEMAEPQECRASVIMGGSQEQKTEKTFKIIADPSFDFRLLSCQDKGCENKTKVFKIGETLYLNYEASVKGANVSAKITGPDKKENPLALGQPFVWPGQGLYAITATAIKAGYKTMTDVLEINVVEEFIEPIDTRICDADKKCEPLRGENNENCPGDCLSEQQKQEAMKKIIAEEAEKAKRALFGAFLPIAIILIVIGAIIVVAYIYYKRKQTANL